MLKTIRLQNIKGHEDSLFELSPGLNVITGDSDSGKSTVSRAFNWLTTNQRGYNPRPWKKLKPKGPSKITVKTLEGSTISRVKHTGINAYEVDGEVFKALGSDVPPEVRTALRLERINLQPQKESYYLLNETSGAVAKEFNNIANLGNMDKALTGIKSLKLQKKGDIESCKRDLESTEQSVKDLEFVEFANTELQDLESRQVTIDCTSKQLQELYSNTILVKYIRTDLRPHNLFEDFLKLANRKIDWSKLNSVSSLVSGVKNINLVPEPLFSDFTLLEVPSRAKLEKVTDLVSSTRIDKIPESLFSDFSFLNENFEACNSEGNLAQSLATAKKLRREIDNSEINTILGKIAELKSQLKICKECGREL